LPGLCQREPTPTRHLSRWSPTCGERYICQTDPSHRSQVDQDDYYEGYFIPKGAYVYANAFTISFDEKTFPDPYAFKPERYLKSDGTFDTSVLNPDFGFGRRVCPGQNLAQFSLASAVASLGWAFTFTAGKDEHGNVVQPDTSPDACTDSGGLVLLVFPENARHDLMPPIAQRIPTNMK
jgi:hypothetical protein